MAQPLLDRCNEDAAVNSIRRKVEDFQVYVGLLYGPIVCGISIVIYFTDAAHGIARKIILLIWTGAGTRAGRGKGRYAPFWGEHHYDFFLVGFWRYGRVAAIGLVRILAAEVVNQLTQDIYVALIQQV
jgi:hypothetical protein